MKRRPRSPRRRAVGVHTGSTWIGNGGVRDDATSSWNVMTTTGAPGPKELPVAVCREASSSSGGGAAGLVGWGTHGLTRQVNTLRLGALCGGGLFELDNDRWGVDLSACARFIPTPWVHVAATFDGTTRRLCFNGAQIASDVPGGTWSADPSVFFAVGRTNSTPEYINGGIDELAIFARALSAGEILDHYRRGALTLKFQLAPCPDAACSSPAFRGPDGTSSTWYSTTSAAGSGSATAPFSGLPAARWYRYRVALAAPSGQPAPACDRSTSGGAPPPPLPSGAAASPAPPSPVRWEPSPPGRAPP